MNDQQGTIITQFFAWLASISAVLGITTQDLAYILFGLIGVMVSIASYVSGRIDARNAQKEDKPVTGADEHQCLCCGTPVAQNAGRKEKKFCSDKCRNKWWNAHLDKVDRRVIREVTCAGCGKTFSVYGQAARKYCSHACYIRHRFGGGADE